MAYLLSMLFYISVTSSLALQQTLILIDIVFMECRMEIISFNNKKRFFIEFILFLMLQLLIFLALLPYIIDTIAPGNNNKHSRHLIS